MLHLLPLRWIAKGLLYLTTFGVFGATIAGLFGPEHMVRDAFSLVRWALMLEAAVAIGLMLGWRYIPGFVNRIFPDISGTWDGEIIYETEGGPKSKPAVLHVHQTISKIRLFLETDESKSETLVALPERDEDFSRFRLFYIYENTRKETAVTHPGYLYRGTAFIEIGPGRPDRLDGAYFTDQKRAGKITFTRQPDNSGSVEWYARPGRAIASFFAPRGASPYLGQRRSDP
jgi:hypothetical protein